MPLHIVYNKELDGFQIVFTPNDWINKDLWNTSYDGKVYQTWDAAMHILDKMAY